MSLNLEKRQTNNPVKAMLDRNKKARVESQTKDIEDQLSLLTGEEPSPSTSASGRSGTDLPEGMYVSTNLSFRVQPD